MSGRKRTADHELTRDDDDDRDTESFITTPQVADESELATRRMVSVKRAAPQAGGSEAAAAPSTGGFFKGFAAVPPTAPKPPATGFSFGSSATAANPFSFTPASSTKTDAAPTAGAPTSGFSFSFGAPAPKPSAEAGKDTDGTAESKKESASAEKPTPAFSFGTPSTTASAPAPSSGSFTGFSFGAPSATASAPAAPATSFSGFSFGAPAAASAAAKPSSDATVPAFGTAAGFSFKAAVNSFAEAQKKLSADKADATADKKDDTAADTTAETTADADEDAPKLFANKSAISSTGGEVLAGGLSKLYIFDKESNKWKEHGEGEARVKKDIVPVKSEGDDSKATEEAVYRLMVRDGYSLNVNVDGRTFVLSKESEKHLIFSVAVEGTKLETYLLKFTGAGAESNAKKVIEEIKKILAATKKD